MKRIGLLSDTHSYWDERYEKYFADVDEIWHAGDIGSTELAERFQAFKPFRAVCDLRRMFPDLLRFKCEDADIMIKHIGGYPGNYDRSIVGRMYTSPPDLFISGHSHILKILYDKTLRCLHINPGAAGLQGWQKVRTLVRFTVDGKEFKDLEVIELGEKKKDKQNQ